MVLTTIELLLIVRRRRKLSVAKAAQRWKLNPRTLNSWEQGTRWPAKDTERRLKRIIRDEERRGF